MESSNKENTNEESYISSQDTLTSFKVIKQYMGQSIQEWTK